MIQRLSSRISRLPAIVVLLVITLAPSVTAMGADATTSGGNFSTSGNGFISAVRVFGAFLLVMAVFWLIIVGLKNWQRLAVPKGVQPQLAVLEMKSLGAKQALFVVAYQQQRMLIASSAAGVTLVSHLPESAEPLPAGASVASGFGEILQQFARRK